MFRTINKVVAGDYAGRKVKVKFFHRIVLCRAFHEPIVVDETTVNRYTVVSQEISKDGKSALRRGCLGTLFFGTVGLLLGCVMAKNKTITTVSLEFKNGDKSLIEVDGRIYKILVKNLYT